ncbi:MAG: hypothetical protein ACI8TQ_001512 [Planctomycetota bacterium]|jgi:hypothetical protein
MTFTSFSKMARALSYTTAGLAAWRMKHSSSQVVTQRSARHLTERLGKLRGLPQKVGQLLSMSSDLQQAETFAPLTDAAQPLPLESVLPLLEEAWGQPPFEICQSIDEHGHAASLGQVHRAVLLDGRVVAIKVQYPGMQSALETDLTALGWIAAPIGNLKAGFDLAAYQKAMQASLQEELDYFAEARNQTEFETAAAGVLPHLIVPQVVESLSTDRVLTTIWEPGEATSSASEWADEERAQLAQCLLNQFLRMLFEDGLMHADPHSGNYRFRRSPSGPKVVLYDYGCVHRFTEPERMTLLRLIAEGANSNSSNDPFPLFVALGFDAALLRPLRAKLPAVARILFQPFGTRGRFDLANWRLSERVEDVLGDDRLNFRIAGPANMLFFLRAFHGLIYHLRELGQPVSWSNPLQKLVKRHSDAMAAVVLSEPSDLTTSYAGLATKLCICVKENGAVKAKVSLPAITVERLDDFIDDEVRKKIQERSIDVQQLIRKVRRQQYAPQSIFELDEQSKNFSVWLE